MLRQPFVRALLLQHFLPNLGALGLVLFLVGIILFLNLDRFGRATEIEEHALMPGYSRSGFKMEPGALALSNHPSAPGCEWATVPAQRGDGREGVVIIFHHPSPLPLVHSLGAYLSKVPWLSKDVVLVRCATGSGVRGWVEHYRLGEKVLF